MRRSKSSLIKYLLLVAVLMYVGPSLLRHLLHNNALNTGDSRGLPQEPGKDKHEGGRGDSGLDSFNANADLHHIDADSKPKRIDWHDHEQIAAELQRVGPGEQGSAVILSAEEEKRKEDLYKVNGYNAFVSDKMSLDRALKDIRHPGCKSKLYSSVLPTASVIIPFHNEHWSTLLRNAQSIVNRSPPELLQEVILVDDFSTKEFLKQQLDDYLATHYGGKVKTVHATKREGLIRTRLLGAKAATGDVLIFLDAHCEVNINWLPPLLDPIATDYRTVVCPFIDIIDFETFAYRAQDEGARGVFNWEMLYKRLPTLPEDQKHPSDPFKSPVMAGGLFAISSKWFWELGGYDPGLDIWGAEQYELSFKLWQCGGQMLDAPCSRVGHVYRKFAPFPNPGIGDFVAKNHKRVAVVWMDEYAEYLYARHPHWRNIDPGDLTDQLAIREKLQCKPFKWFMTEVAFDLPKMYPMIEPQDLATGELRNIEFNMCVDTRFKNQNERFSLEECLKDNPGAGGEQKMALSWHHDIRPMKRTVCFDASQSLPKTPVILFGCHGMKGNQHFKYNLETKQLVHPISRQCLDGDKENKEIFMNPCDVSKVSQQWQFENMNVTAVEHEWKYE